MKFNTSEIVDLEKRILNYIWTGQQVFLGFP